MSKHFDISVLILFFFALLLAILMPLYFYFRLNADFILFDYVIFSLASILFLISGLVWQRKYHKPFSQLLQGVELIADGNLDYRIEPSGNKNITKLASGVNSLAKEFMTMATNLEDTVLERTKRLNSTVNDLHKLKVAQDGDYFLTTLLVNPLQGNNNKTKNISCQFLVNQFKRFTFKKQKYDIGGDLCLTETVFIGNKEYTFFINADAMGKSIQGAGGVIVIGAALQAHLAEARIGKSSRKLPEQWLRKLYLNIQDVFLSFKGSMMVSAALGLIDSQTGLLYYLNVEHPFSVLFRDGKASFIEEEIHFRKFGMPRVTDSSFTVKMLQLKAGDKIISASDGRDDIVKEIVDGKRVFYEDDKLFLQTVENSKGNISEILSQIESTGQIIDDLSVLALEVCSLRANLNDDIEVEQTLEKVTGFSEANNQVAAIGTARTLVIGDIYHLVLILTQAKILHSQKQYDISKNLCQLAIGSFPERSGLYLLFAEEIREIEPRMAIDYAESFLIRCPDSILGKVMLIDLHTLIENWSRVDFLNQKLAHFEKGKPLWLMQAEKFYRNKNYGAVLETLPDKPENDFFLRENYFLKANCHFFLKHFKQAEEFYMNSLEYTGPKAKTLNMLGQVYFKQKKGSRAAKLWQMALQLSPNYQAARANLAALL